MGKGLITRTTTKPVQVNPGWNGRAIPGMTIGISVALILLFLGPFGVVLGLVHVPVLLTQAWVGPFLWSIGFAIIGGGLATMVAIPLGWLLARGGPEGFGGLSTGMIRLGVIVGLVCPPALIGLGISRLAHLPAVLGLGPAPGIATAFVIVTALGLPFAALTMEAAWRMTTPEMESIAASMGWNVRAILRVLVRPILTPAIVPAFGLAVARVLGEEGALAIIGTNTPATLAILGTDGSIAVPGLTESVGAILLLLSVGVLIVCKGSLFTLIPYVTHRFSTHLYTPDILNVPDQVEPLDADQTDPTQVEDDEDEVAAFFASLEGPGAVFSDVLTDEEAQYLRTVDTQDKPQDTVWEGAPGMPKAWASPGTYWPGAPAETTTETEAVQPVARTHVSITEQAKARMHTLSTHLAADTPTLHQTQPDQSASQPPQRDEAVQDPDRHHRKPQAEDDNTALGKRTTTPFLKIRTRNDDEASDD